MATAGWNPDESRRDGVVRSVQVSGGWLLLAKHPLSFDVNVREGKPSNTKNNRMKASFSGRWHGYNTLAALALAQHALPYFCFVF